MNLELVVSATGGIICGLRRGIGINTEDAPLLIESILAAVLDKLVEEGEKLPKADVEEVERVPFHLPTVGSPRESLGKLGRPALLTEARRPLNSSPGLTEMGVRGLQACRIAPDGVKSWEVGGL